MENASDLNAVNSGIEKATKANVEAIHAMLKTVAAAAVYCGAVRKAPVGARITEAQIAIAIQEFRSVRAALDKN
ncbi:MAG: hypothetical protein LBR94_05710 [Desulfovibrio sp.]|jgi:hypothetical protein|nr:hypothetical protein [Desulfovibrio sp.]